MVWVNGSYKSFELRVRRNGIRDVKAYIERCVPEKRQGWKEGMKD